MAEPGDAIKRQAQDRFARSAREYVESSILAEGWELGRMVELVGGRVVSLQATFGMVAARKPSLAGR